MPLTSNQIRQQFLDFFRSKQHAIVDSSPVVPHDDPTLLFTNAGMNQFKPIFLGTADPKSEFGRMKRAADTQKCIRAGGKHNDLDDVGKDTYHHTFFEMLGNWSFGDYFKKEAIEWAWELLTKVWGIDKTRLHATYFQGDPAEGLEPDTEAATLWRTVTDIDPSHIHPGNKKDNFWEMGDTGPCGPCSEIHIDLTPDKSGGNLVNAGDARVMEVWNLVFIQFNRGPDGKLSPLPAKHVDTGMGFERICSVLQGMHAGRLGAFSNYDTDVFTPLFAAIQERTGAPKYRGTLPSDPRSEPGASAPDRENRESRRLEDTKGNVGEVGTNRNRERTDSVEPVSNRFEPPSPNEKDRLQTGPTPHRLKTGATQDQGRSAEGVERPVSDDQLMIDVSYRVIADHLRCLTFAITDGAVPSNEGRGFVLRRILRRAVRYGRQYLNIHEPFLCDLVPALIEHMGGVFHELRVGPDAKHPRDNVKHVANILRDEEASFIKTLDRGIRLFNEAADYAVEHHHGRISGDAAFKLHDTYGFPIDLTELMAEERGLTIDIGEYERLMEEARVKARAVGEMKARLVTDDVRRHGKTEFTGHSTLVTSDAVVWATYRQVGDELEGTASIESGQDGALVINPTPFYAEQGGQVGDRGIIQEAKGGWEFEVSDTKKVGETFLHLGRCIRGSIIPRSRAAVASGYVPSVDANRELGIVRASVRDATRTPTMQNHSATHVMNWALREVLGNHVQQKGSLVDPEKTRFDLSHPQQISNDELTRIESQVNDQIAAKLPVYTKEVDQQIARKINTLRAVFGEKYPDVVRVVSIGVDIDEMLTRPDDPKWMKYSVEFCGGTHVKNTAEIGHFVLIHEEGVAKGVRRLVGISGEAARKAEADGELLLGEIAALEFDAGIGEPSPLRKQRTNQPGDTSGASAPGSDRDRPLSERLAAFTQAMGDIVIPLRIRHQLRDRLTELQKIAKQHEKQSASASGDAVMDKVASLFASAQTINGVTIVVGEVPAAPVDALRGAIDWVRNKTKASAVLLAMVEDNRVTLLAGMSKDVVDKGLKAGDLIKDIAPLVGGKGGGRPDMAQGGGTDVGGLSAAIGQAKRWMAAKLS